MKTYNVVLQRLDKAGKSIGIPFLVKVFANNTFDAGNSAVSQASNSKVYLPALSYPISKVLSITEFNACGPSLAYNPFKGTL